MITGAQIVLSGGDWGKWVLVSVVPETNSDKEQQLHGIKEKRINRKTIVHENVTFLLFYFQAI